jgi:two-component system, NtrC family, response regulator AtoC
MPAGLQAKLLHVLQDQTFSRLGSRTMVKVDVRILAATNIDIPEALANKRLREDLYYRLNAFTMSLPPLRERKEEIPDPAETFHVAHVGVLRAFPVAAFASVDGGMPAAFWPGNLRELSNFIKRYLVLGDETLAASELQPRPDGGGGMHVDGRSAVAGAESGGGLKSLSRNAKDEAEAEAIARALEETNWNRKQAAALLKISYKALAL